MTFANCLTVGRIAAIPVVLALGAFGHERAALALLALALLSDLVDGPLARALGQTSSLGALLDPVADKAVVLTFLPVLAAGGEVPAWFAVLACFRQLAQLSAIPILGWLGIGFKVAPGRIPKWATAILFAIVWLGCARMSAAGGRLPAAGLAALVAVSAALEVWVLAAFLPRFVQIARGRHDTFE